MTISSTVNRDDYVGSGSTDTYSYTFRIVNEAHLQVTQRDTDDVETTLTLNVDYTVTGVGSASGGTIVLTAGNLTLNYELTIRRVVPLKQETDIRNQGDFYPENHEDAFDYLMMCLQQIQDEVDRSVRLAETDGSVSVQLPVAEALKLVRFNAAGNALELITVADLGAVSTVTLPLKLTGSDLSIDSTIFPLDEWIVVSNDPDDQDYATLAAYIADSPSAGDRVIVKDSQTLSAQMVIPDGITLRFYDGATINCATNIATSVVQTGSNTIIEGVLNIILSHTGTTVSAFEINGDNNFGNVVVENSSTGQLTNAFIINASKGNNHINGIARNTGGGTLTNPLTDNSAENSNNVNIVDEANTKIIRSNGSETFNDISVTNDISLSGAINLGSDASGDIYYRNGTALVRLAKGSDGDILQLASGIPNWFTPADEYTPTGTAVANVSSITVVYMQYKLANGFVSGVLYAAVVPTAGATLTQFRATIPVASTFTGPIDGIGGGSAKDSTAIVAAQLFANATYNELDVYFYSNGTGSHTVVVPFSYQVL